MCGNSERSEITGGAGGVPGPLPSPDRRCSREDEGLRVLCKLRSESSGEFQRFDSSFERRSVCHVPARQRPLPVTTGMGDTQCPVLPARCAPVDSASCMESVRLIVALLLPAAFSFVPTSSFPKDLLFLTMGPEDSFGFVTFATSDVSDLL